MCTNTTPTTSWTQLSDLTPATNFPANVDGNTVTTTSSSSSGGTYTLVLEDLTMTATGSVGPFRYVYVYNDTATNDELIGYIDYGSELTLANTETLTLDFNVATITLA